MEGEDTGRVECGENLDDVCCLCGDGQYLGLAYLPVGIGSLYQGIDVWTDWDHNGKCRVFFVRHCPKQQCADDGSAPVT